MEAAGKRTTCDRNWGFILRDTIMEMIKAADDRPISIHFLSHINLIRPNVLKIKFWLLLLGSIMFLIN
jgi:hypothetical protein